MPTTLSPHLRPDPRRTVGMVARCPPSRAGWLRSCQGADVERGTRGTRCQSGTRSRNAVELIRQTLDQAGAVGGVYAAGSGRSRQHLSVCTDVPDRVDLLVNNAEVVCPPVRQNSKGLECTFAIKYLGHDEFVVGSASTARVVNASSGLHHAARLDSEDRCNSDTVCSDGGECERRRNLRSDTEKIPEAGYVALG